MPELLNEYLLLRLHDTNSGRLKLNEAFVLNNKIAFFSDSLDSYLKLNLRRDK